MIRIRDPQDQTAWQEFAEIYRPAVYRFARRRGLHAEDADDIAQHVLMALLRKIGDWKSDREVGSFRAWLLTVTRNAVSNKAVRKLSDVACGGSGVVGRMSDIVDDRDESQAFQRELQRATFRRAAAEVRPEFQETTWQAFWLTAVEQISAEQAACDLGVSVGAIYTARSRVLKRIRDRVSDIGFYEL